MTWLIRDHFHLWGHSFVQRMYSDNSICCQIFCDVSRVLAMWLCRPSHQNIESMFIQSRLSLWFDLPSKCGKTKSMSNLNLGLETLWWPSTSVSWKPSAMWTSHSRRSGGWKTIGTRVELALLSQLRLQRCGRVQTKWPNPPNTPTDNSQHMRKPSQNQKMFPAEPNINCQF